MIVFSRCVVDGLYIYLFDQGRQAEFMGLPRWNNPYQEGTDQFYIWDNGWCHERKKEWFV